MVVLQFANYLLAYQESDDNACGLPIERHIFEVYGEQIDCSFTEDCSPGHYGSSLH